MDTGALVKDYEGPEKETEQAVQMSVSKVTFEDERYLVGPAYAALRVRQLTHFDASVGTRPALIGRGIPSRDSCRLPQ
jgi:hypothetical protein